MKKLFLFLYAKGSLDDLIETARQNYQDAMSASIMLGTYTANEKEFIDAESRLLSGVATKQLQPAKDALADLRDLYAEHGAMPTQTDSGKYVMLHFLDDVEECLDIVSAEDPGWK